MASALLLYYCFLFASIVSLPSCFYDNVIAQCFSISSMDTIRSSSFFRPIQTQKQFAFISISDRNRLSSSSYLSYSSFSPKKKRTIWPQHAAAIIQQQIEPLIPEINPIGVKDVNATSCSGVRYEDVYHFLEQYYPSPELEKRNAISRTDGYWPYVQTNQDVPKQYTYGEFDFHFFAQILDRCASIIAQHDPYFSPKFDNANNATITNNPTGTHFNTNNNHNSTIDWTDKVFCDIGSGAGRLVVAASVLHPTLRLCRGIEILPGLSNVAQENVKQCKKSILLSQEEQEETSQLPLEEQEEAQIQTEQLTYLTDDIDGILDNDETSSLRNGSGDNTNDERIIRETENSNLLNTVGTNDNNNSILRLAPMEFECGSFDDPYVYYGDADIVFVFSSCMGTDIIRNLATSIGRQCKPGTIVVTTDTMLVPLSGVVPPVVDLIPADDRIPTGTYQYELLETVDGYCWLTGGTATAYIHRIMESCSSPRLDRPVRSLEDYAFDVAMQYELKTLTPDTTTFLRGVYNNMVFANLPKRFWPKRFRETTNE